MPYLPDIIAACISLIAIPIVLGPLMKEIKKAQINFENEKKKRKKYNNNIDFRDGDDTTSQLEMEMANSELGKNTYDMNTIKNNINNNNNTNNRNARDSDNQENNGMMQCISNTKSRTAGYERIDERTLRQSRSSRSSQSNNNNADNSNNSQGDGGTSNDPNKRDFVF